MEVKPQGNDELVWPRKPKGSFKIKSFCNALQYRLRCSDFSSVAIWRSKAPPKAFFLVFLHGQSSKKMFQLPTEDFLKRRNFHGPSRCALCLQEDEFVHHFLVHSSWVFSLWHLGLPLMGVSWVQPLKVKDCLLYTSPSPRD